MTDKDDNGPPEELTQEDVIRLVNEAKARGESPTPIIRRYALQAIRRVIKSLEAKNDPTSRE